MSDPNAPNLTQVNPNVPSPEVIREFPDRGTQWLLEDPVHLQSLLQLLQPELAARLDVSRAQRINRTMIPTDLQKQESDLIFRIPYRAARVEASAEREETDRGEREWEVLIYVLLEHQSQHDPLMALRLLLYMVELWSEQLRVAAAAHVPKRQVRVYPVIPLVFYTDESEWTTPLDLAHLMDLPPELARFVPHWDTLFLNLHETPPQTLTQFSTAVGYALRVFQAEHGPLAELETVVREALAGLEGLSEEQSGQWLRMAWFVLLLVFHRRERSDYDVLGAQIRQTTRASKFANRTEVDQMAQTMAQTMAQYHEELGRQAGIQAGIQEGRQEGRQEGIEIGQARATRHALLTVLTARFGELPPTIAEAAEVAGTEQLEKWLRVAVTAVSLEEIGMETQH